MKMITQAIIQDCLKNRNLELKSTQHQLSIPIINRMYRKMINGIKFSENQIHEDLIIDGHHRYIIAQLANQEIQSRPSNRNSSMKIYEWENVNFVDEEWDTVHKIQLFNRLDATYNQISIERMDQIIE